MNKQQMLRYIGDFSQLFGIREYTLQGGRSKDVKAFDIRNGSGLEFTVLADRCLDIAGLSFILEYLEPGETRDFDLTIELVSGSGEIESLIKMIKSYSS